MLKDKTFIVIQSWMRTELKLSGNRLTTYAIIYGYSQGENGVFSGSSQYIADWCGITKRSALNVLASLVDDGYIKKTDKTVNGVHLCDYSASPVVKKFHHPGEEISPVPDENFSPVPDEKTSPHNIDLDNIDINNKDNDIKKQKRFIPPKTEDVKEYCEDNNFDIDPEAFVDHYSATGWMVGKNKMKDWHAAVRTWVRNSRKWEKEKNRSPSGVKIDLGGIDFD